MKSKLTQTRWELGLECGLVMYVLAILNLSADTLITFQVDMTVQAQIGRFTLGTGSVGALGSRWINRFQLTNDAAGPNPYFFSGSLRDTNDSPGSMLSYKFYYHPGTGGALWESPVSTCGSNRTVTLPAINGASLVLPVVYFDDLPAGVPLVTNEVTFQVDMSAQRPGLGPDQPNGTQTCVSCLGSFNGWNDLSLTNNPSTSNTNLYSGVLNIVSQPGAHMEYKFFHAKVSQHFSGRYTTEQPLSTGGANRSFSLLATNGPLVLPVVLFGDLEPSDLLPAYTLVHFGVDMAGAVGTDRHVFDPAIDKVYVNGDFLCWVACGADGGCTVGWAPWESCFWPDRSRQLTNVPGSQIYSAAIPIWPPNAVALTYRYTINGPDNEPPGGQNHLRYVRTTGEYTLPLDKFGAPDQEPSFGNLTATRSDPGHALISWLGRPGVHLQSCADPSAGSWRDHVETDGLSSTNWPVAGGHKFFRLVKP